MWDIWLVFALIGLLGGSFGSMIGMGGVFISTPLMGLAAAWLGFAIRFNEIVSISMVMALASIVGGLFVHKKKNRISRTLVFVAGSAAAAGSFAGAYVSSLLPENVVRLCFALAAIAAVALMVWPKRTERGAAEAAAAAEPDAPRMGPARGLLVGGGAAGVGMVSGIVGAAGGFLMSPFLYRTVGFPLRTVIGSMGAIGLLGAAFGVAGKMMTHQTPIALAICVAAGSLAGGPLGAWLSYKLSVRALRSIMLAFIALMAIQMMYASVIHWI